MTDGVQSLRGSLWSRESGLTGGTETGGEVRRMKLRGDCRLQMFDRFDIAERGGG